MKILHIGNLKTGVDICVRNILAYTGDGFEFVVVNGADDRNKPYSHLGKEVKAYQIPMYRALNPFRDVRALMQAVRIIRKEKPDLIHCHSAKGGVIGRFAAFLTGKKAAYTAHAFSFLSAESENKKKVYLLFEKLTRLNAYLIGCSQSERELGIRQVGYPAENAFVWNNSIPQIQREGVVRPHQLAEGERYIVTIARPSYQKNTLLMVDIMEQVHRVVPDLKLYVVGAEFYSPLLEEMKVRVRDKKMEETVKILPWLSHQEALGFLKFSQLYLTTSIYEGLPIAVLEAMALEKAVVASDVIGNRDCVKDGENGVLLPLEVKQFADTICRLLDDEEERRRMGKRSKEIFEAQFMIDHRIRQLEDIYSKIYRA